MPKDDHVGNLISESIIGYYRNINEQLEAGLEDPEQEEVFLCNVFEQLVKDIKEIAFHQRTSFVVQKLLRKANEEQLASIMKILIKNWEAMITQRSASFVVQTALYRCTEFLSDDEENIFVKFFHQIGMMLLERAELVTDSKSSHVVRTLIEVMSGMQHDRDREKKSGKSQSNFMKEHEFHEEFTDLLSTLSVMVLPTSLLMADVVDAAHNSATAQIILQMLHKKFPAVCKDVCKKIIDGGIFSQLDGDGLPKMMTGVNSSYFCSVLVEVLTKVPLGLLIKEVVVPHFDSLVTSKTANFVLQKIIANIQTEKQMNRILKVTEGKFFRLIEENRGHVLLSILKAALRFPYAQVEVISKFREEANAENSNINFVVAVAIGTLLHNLLDDELLQKLVYMSYTCSMLIQALFRFEDTSFICSSIDSFSEEQFISLATGTFGCFIYDAYLKSDSVDLKTRKNLAKRLNKNTCFPLANNKFGSRVFDMLWAYLPVPDKRDVAEELSPAIQRLLASPHGRVIAYNIHLQDYKHNRKEWDSWLTKENKANKAIKLASKAGKRSAAQATISATEDSPKKKRRKTSSS